MKQTEGLKPFPPPFHSCGRLNTRYQQLLDRFQTPFSRRFMVVGIICFLGLPALILNDYSLHLLNMICIYAIAAIGLNILTGYAGQLSLCHGAFLGIGAYTGALLTAKAGFPFFLAIPVAGVVTAMIGAIFAIPSLRLKPIYLPMATLAGQFIAEHLLLHWVSLTGGSKGLVTAKPVIAGFNLGTNLSLFYITAFFLLLVTWLTDNLLRSKIGRAFLAIRLNEPLAAAMGIAAYPHKLLAFTTSSFFAGLAGALFAYSTETLTPILFKFTLSIEFLAVILIGGLGSISGSIIGAAAMVFLNEILAFINGYLITSELYPSAITAFMPMEEFVLGLVIVLFVMFKPKGLASICHKIRRGFQRWPFS